ncbi:MAG: glycosyltransferase family 9 protein [bacterium]
MTSNIKRFLKILRLEVELFVVLIIGLTFVFIDKIKNLPTISSNNILFIQIYGIGNFILSSTMQVAIRGQSTAKIFAIVHPAIKELADKAPYIDEIIVYEDRSFSGKIKLIKQIRKTNFALAVDLSGTYWTAWLSRLSRAPKRVGFNAVGVKRLGFNLNGSGKLYTLGIPFNHDIHMKEFYDSFLTVLDVPLNDKELKIFPSKEDDKFATQLLKEWLGTATTIITIHIGARQKERLWEVEKFSELITELLKKGAKIILSGAVQDIERGIKILSLLNPSYVEDKSIISIVGKTTLYQLASIISKSIMFIGHDSGPMHIACAVKTKVVALFGPGVVELWSPWLKESVVVHSQVQCQGCNKIGHFYKCKENICMSRISVAQVLNAVEKLLSL